jgi:hypothetical protein
VELLALELARRRGLQDAGEAAVLDVGTWPLGALSEGPPADEDEDEDEAPVD